MNAAQRKCLVVFSVFAVVGFGPVSPGCLIGIYIVWRRPEWFSAFVAAMYDYPERSVWASTAESKQARILSAITLFTLLLIDIAPFPVTPMIAVPIIVFRPPWFYDLVQRIYGAA
jgi:hypothetical protein